MGWKLEDDLHEHFVFCDCVSSLHDLVCRCFTDLFFRYLHIVLCIREIFRLFRSKAPRRSLEDGLSHD